MEPEQERAVRLTWNRDGDSHVAQSLMGRWRITKDLVLGLEVGAAVVVVGYVPGLDPNTVEMLERGNELLVHGSFPTVAEAKAEAQSVETGSQSPEGL